MNMRNTVLAGMILLVLAFTISIGTAQSDNQASKDTKEIDEIEPYGGPIGPDNVLYGLKLALENLDETFTFNASEKLQKKIAHAKLRIAEAKAELKKNDTEDAEKAFERYREKIGEANESVSRFSGRDSGLEHALEMIKKHQRVLKNLAELHPNSSGLRRAYENSLELEDKFKEKIEEREETEEGHVKIKAEIIDNATKVKVSIKFTSDNTTNFTIAREIRDKLQLSSGDIATIIELKVEEGEEKELKTKLEAEAGIERGITKVEAEYMFPLNATNRTEIIDGVFKKLSILTPADILNVLEIKVKQEEKEVKEERKEAVKEEKKQERSEDKKDNKKED